MMSKISDAIAKVLLREKTPLWMVIAYGSFAVPVAILIILLPPFGGLWYDACVATGQSVCQFPPNYMWVISTGLAACIYLDTAVFILAYITFKYDHYLPWLYRKFGRARRLRTEEL